MDQHEIETVLADDVTTALIDRAPLMRIAYTGRDGGPRVVPLAGPFLRPRTQIVPGRRRSPAPRS